jgi:hypothetical protein
MKKYVLFIFGLIFIFSAITKLIYIDKFELFIYSFHIISFNLSAIAARVIISMELLLGIFLNIQNTKKQAWRLSLFMLLFFSIFLVIQLFVQPESHCHCFGEILQLKPWPSLLKNAILIAGLFVLSNSKTLLPRMHKLLIILIIFAGVLSVNIYSPPDFLMEPQTQSLKNNKLHLLKKLEKVNTKECFEGKKMVCFFSPSCRYCKKAAWKTSIMVKKYGIEENVIYLFMGNHEIINTFFELSGSSKFDYKIIPPKMLLRITDGAIPKIFLVENGEVIKKYGYRDLSEKGIKKFFMNEPESEISENSAE